MDTKMKAWPEPDAVGRVSNRELYLAAMRRLRVAVEALKMYEAYQDWNGNHSALSALTLIGELPKEQEK